MRKQQKRTHSPTPRCVGSRSEDKGGQNSPPGQEPTAPFLKTPRRRLRLGRCGGAGTDKARVEAGTAGGSRGHLQRGRATKGGNKSPASRIRGLTPLPQSCSAAWPQRGVREVGGYPFQRVTHARLSGEGEKARRLCPGTSTGPSGAQGFPPPFETLGLPMGRGCSSIQGLNAFIPGLTLPCLSPEEAALVA